MLTHDIIGHGGWVACMQVGEVVDADQKKEFLITGSRDKSLMIWDIQEKGDADADKEWGVPRKIFKGKNLIYGFIRLFQQVTLTSSATSLSLKTADTFFQVHGTELSAFGT